MDQTPLIWAETPLIRDETPLIWAGTPLIRNQTPLIWAEIPLISDQTPLISDQTPLIRDQTPLLRDQTPTNFQTRVNLILPSLLRKHSDRGQRRTQREGPGDPYLRYNIFVIFAKL